MKYSDSFECIFTQEKGDEGTLTSDWFDVSWANELYAYVTVDWDETVAGGANESCTSYIERNTPDSTATVLTFSTVVDDASEEETHATSNIDGNAGVAANNKIGMRVRFKMTSTAASAWAANQTLTVTCTMYAKRN